MMWPSPMPPTSKSQYFRRFLAYTLDYKSLLALAIFMGLAKFAMNYTFPWLIGAAVDHVVKPEDAATTEAQRMHWLWILVGLGVFFSIPSLIIGTPLENKWPSWFPHYKISLGLDLAGGSHLLLEADAKDAQRQRLQSMEESVSTELRRGAKIDIGDISTAGGRLSSSSAIRPRSMPPSSAFAS